MQNLFVCEWIGPGYTSINSGQNALNPIINAFFPYNSVTKFFFLCKGPDIKGLDIASIPKYYRDAIQAWMSDLMMNVHTCYW
jgi:hypothetical protein